MPELMMPKHDHEYFVILYLYERLWPLNSLQSFIAMSTLIQMKLNESHQNILCRCILNLYSSHALTKEMQLLTGHKFANISSHVGRKKFSFLYLMYRSECSYVGSAFVGE